MTRARVLQEVRQMRFEELYERRQQRILTMAEAGEMLGVTGRTFRRRRGRDHAGGADGPQGMSPGPLDAAPIARSGRANPCRGCCCIRTARRMSGSPAVSGI